MKKHLSIFLFSFVATCGFLLPAGLVHATTTPITNDITVNTTWTTASSTYLIQNNISISAGVTLTVNPGVVVKFRSAGTGLYVNGTLNAGGSSTSTTYFTSYKDDSVGGNTDGATSTPLAGDWDMIQVNSGGTATFNNATIRYGGYYSYNNIYNYGGTLNVLNSTVATSTHYGIYHKSGVTNIATSTLHTNGEYGIYVYNSTGTTTITNTTFHNNPTATGYFDFTSAFYLSNSNNIATGTGKRGFIVYAGSLGKSQTWKADTVPYIISSSGFNVTSGKTLTINPGAVVKFENSSAYLTVNGANSTLSAIGNSVQPIYFTSIKDDILNDTDGSATTTPTAGDWARIEANTNGTANFQYATIRYGGVNNLAANVFNNGGTFNISSSTISNAKYYGIKRDAGTVNLTQSSLFGNGTQAYFNNTTATTTATNNFWGNSSGPYNAKYNPSGTGNAVSDYVSFVPWLYGTSTGNTPPSIPTNFTVSVESATGLNLSWTSATSTAGISRYLIEKCKGAGCSNFVQFAAVAASTSVPYLDYPLEASTTYSYRIRAISNNESSSIFSSVVSRTTSAPITISSNISTNTTWTAGNVYVIQNAITINSGVTLTIPWRTIVKFNGTSTGMTVSGTLTAVGNSFNNIYFTSYKDDTVGGDTNGDGAGSSPASQDWRNISANTGGTVTLSYAVVRYGGNGANTSNLRVSGGTLNATYSEIKSSYTGAYLASGTMNISSSTVSGNSAYGMQSLSTTTQIAERNYWGASSGPYNPTSNPTGTGNAVTNGFDFTPWAGQGNYLFPWNSVNSSKELRWSGSTQCTTAWNSAISAWNSLKSGSFGVLIAPADVQHPADLLVYADIYDPTLGWGGQYVAIAGQSGVETIQFNKFWMNKYAMTDASRQSAVTHELGHALGLEHSFIGNIMHYSLTNQTSFGVQDSADYTYCWTASACYKTPH